MSLNRPLLLIVLDGWGYTETSKSNAITLAKTPNWDQLWANNSHTLINASGLDVGLPLGQMGNSEVGHMTLGSGRVIFQDLTLINNAISDGSFFKNQVLLNALSTAKQNKTAVHILGLLSPGGVHSHEEQIFSMLKMCAQQNSSPVYVHAFLDGRDTPPQSAHESLNTLEQLCTTIPGAHIGSITGRFYAMDRDKRTERTDAAFNLLTKGQAKFHASDALTALKQAYARGETDEFVQPTLIDPSSIIKPGDVVIFMNFRADRARQLSYALTTINPKLLGDFVTLTDYDSKLSAHVAFPKLQINNTLGAVLSKHNLTQLRIAETEKYAHVTFFFDAGQEQPYPGEERILIPSPKVSTYDKSPAMAAIEITDNLVNCIQQKSFDVIICNFANADMLGHTGNMDAAIQAIEIIDHCLGRIAAAIKEYGGQAIITADHGNAEIMWDETAHQPHTAHTTNLVPVLHIGEPKIIFKPISIGKYFGLRDVAPTILKLLNIVPPNDMTGTSLIQGDQ